MLTKNKNNVFWGLKDRKNEKWKVRGVNGVEVLESHIIENMVK